jgi:predicted nucleic acid-binding protein
LRKNAERSKNWDGKPLRLVIADTGPVNYLILIGHIDVLPRMFERVVLPTAVQSELSNSLAPPAVQRWIADFPAWLEIAQTPAVPLLTGIHKGEAAAIALAAAMHADLLLMDDRRGLRAAKQQGLRVTGTLGILDLAAQRGLAKFAQAVERLRQTNFRVPQAVLDALLEKHTAKKGRV